MNCDLAWSENLPQFQLGTDIDDIPLRCLMAGGEIKDNMMDRNGFTAEESVVLMGGHLIGLTRNIFGGLQGQWVDTGRDQATSNGPVLDHSFHSFLVDDISSTTVDGFDLDRTPFDEDFPDWFGDTSADVNYLDTDVVLAFPSQNTAIHPDFHIFTQSFAGSNGLFESSFMSALNKMSKLGVSTPLSDALSCDLDCIP